jgi:hypothetical protein
MSIVRAAEATAIYYPTAKAINKVYKREHRVQKRSFRYRTKKEDEACGVVRNKIPIERILFREVEGKDHARITCGIKKVVRKTIAKFTNYGLSSLTKFSNSSCHANLNPSKEATKKAKGYF